MLALPSVCSGTNWDIIPTSFPLHIFGEHRGWTHRDAASQGGTKEGMEPVRGLLRALFLLLCVVNALSRMHSSWDGKSAMKSEYEEDETEKGTRWAVLIAGSSGYGNYRHQADVCHAYQILRRGGLKDENIVVFMYDDIANSEENPYPGKIFNKPNGPDVYTGVPKDYTGSNVTVSNFHAAILGDKDAIVGGSGKVVASGPNDHIFIYFTDHGGPGCLGMPEDPILYADEFVDTLKKKAAAGTFKKMVIYLEACESGSIFDGLLPEGLNIYVTTASDPEENSWGTYCPGTENPPPQEFRTCLGDLYSVAWMEDTEIENLKKETLNSQYKIVKKRTSNYDTYTKGSHVMQYGDIEIDAEKVELYLGFDPANENATEPEVPETEVRGTSMHVPQREADLLHLWHKYYNEAEGSIRKAQAGMELTRTIAHRMHVDNSVKFIGELLFGHEAGQRTLQAVRPAGRILVDDWACLKSMVRAFEASCGPLTQYGMKHMRAFANICNAGIDISAMATATSQACRVSNTDSGIRTLDTSRFSSPV